MAVLDTEVLIIGGGATGTGVARDLALRGVQCIVAEKGDINAGASGRNHGLLHSGGRYVSNDPTSAEECRSEATLLKKLAPQCIEDTGGLFVAIEGDDERFIADFPLWCKKCGIPVRQLTPQEALEMEPGLSKRLIAAYSVMDASIDPFRLSLENMAHAQQLGAKLMRHTRVTQFKSKNKRIQTVTVLDVMSGKETLIKAEQVVNAAGAWAGEIAALANIPIKLIYSQGSLLVASQRLATRVINRLRPPSDGDILVPGGTVSILGTTSVRIPALHTIHPTVEEVDHIIDQFAQVVPVLEDIRYIRAYAGVRPLLDTQSKGDDRSVSRGFSIFDHGLHGLENFTTITGGKLTTFRLMAEQTADLVCQKLGVTATCLTRTEPLPPTETSRWTMPGEAPKHYIKEADPKDMLICECEMVPKSILDRIIASILNQNGTPDLQAIAIRSRMGKGVCQGTFCAVRADACMLDQGQLSPKQDLSHIRAFLCERWNGQLPILWNGQLIQAELLEAVHCGFLGLELEDSSLEDKMVSGQKCTPPTP